MDFSLIKTENSDNEVMSPKEGDTEIILALPAEEDNEINGFSIIKNKEIKSVVKCIDINQNQTLLACGTDKGFRVLKLPSLEVTIMRENNLFPPKLGVNSISILYETMMLALALDGTNKFYSITKVYIWDEKQKGIIKEVECYYKLKKVYFQRDNIIVSCLSESKFLISVYSLEDRKKEAEEQATSVPGKVNRLRKRYEFPLTNKKVPWDAVKDEKFYILAFADSNKEVTVFKKAYGLNVKFTPFKGEHAQHIKLNKTGTIVACANETGTVINLHSTLDGKLIKELYRGRKPCEITDIQFCNKEKYLGLLSDRGTLHLFNLVDDPQQNMIANIIKGNQINSFFKYSIEKHYEKIESDSVVKAKCSPHLLFSKESQVSIFRETGEFEKIEFDKLQSESIKKGYWFDNYLDLKRRVDEIETIFRKMRLRGNLNKLKLFSKAKLQRDINKN